MTPGDVVAGLRALGVGPGATVLVHCGFDAAQAAAFEGGPADLAQAFVDAVSPGGTVAMMTMPYQGMSSHAWLTSEAGRRRPFDPRRTVSRVGLVTEVFRRRPDAVRSSHPTHPVAAEGPGAAWLIGGRPEAASGGPDPAPFGPGSPFARLVDADPPGRVLLWGVAFDRMTFEHHLEHRLHAAGALPVPLYRPEPVTAQVRSADAPGGVRDVPVLCLTEAVNVARRRGALARALLRAGALRLCAVGPVPVLVADCAGMAAAVDALAARGRSFHGNRPRVLLDHVLGLAALRRGALPGRRAGGTR